MQNQESKVDLDALNVAIDKVLCYIPPPNKGEREALWGILWIIPYYVPMVFANSYEPKIGKI